MGSFPVESKGEIFLVLAPGLESVCDVDTYEQLISDLVFRVIAVQDTN